MASQPIPTNPVIQPQSPPEMPVPDHPQEAPVREPPEVSPVQPDIDTPSPEVPETPPPPD